MRDDIWQMKDFTSVVVVVVGSVKCGHTLSQPKCIRVSSFTLAEDRPPMLYKSKASSLIIIISQAEGFTF
jgi:hypothetical protein